MKQGNVIPIVTVLASLVMSIGLTSCSSERRIEAAAPETVSDVQVVLARKATVPDWLEAVGTVRATQTSQLASQIMGTLVNVDVREGERVQAGQVLAVIDDAQPRAAVEQATAAEFAAQKNVSATESEYEPLLVSLHGVCGAESISVCFHELVSDDDHPSQSRRERIVLSLHSPGISRGTRRWRRTENTAGAHLVLARECTKHFGVGGQ